MSTYTENLILERPNFSNEKFYYFLNNKLLITETKMKWNNNKTKY